MYKRDNAQNRTNTKIGKTKRTTIRSITTLTESTELYSKGDSVYHRSAFLIVLIRLYLFQINY